jgi:acyl-CoA dehydrogenase
MARKPGFPTAASPMLYCVFARTGEAPGAKGLSCFLVPADTPGLEIAERLEVIAPHPLARLHFDNVPGMPASAMIGEPGEGFKVAMSVLDVFRSTVAAAALGFARRALDETLSRVRERELFGAPMASCRWCRAISPTWRSMWMPRRCWSTAPPGPRTRARRASPRGGDGEALCHRPRAEVIDKAVQLHGGDGVRKGHIVESLYREIRALRIYEGASDVQKVVIARQTLAVQEVECEPAWTSRAISIPLPVTTCLRSISGRTCCWTASTIPSGSTRRWN